MVKFKSSDREIQILALRIQEIVQNSPVDEKGKNGTTQQPNSRAAHGLVIDLKSAAPKDLADDVAWFSAGTFTRKGTLNLELCLLTMQ
jgi:hypothetical protein